MEENIKTLVRENLMIRKGYTPYCGDMCVRMPRTYFNGKQFQCPSCGWKSDFPKEFIDEYKAKWDISK